MTFYSRDWLEIGTKTAIKNTLSQITGIDEDVLSNNRYVYLASIARRMSWASHRVTRRPEDIAYCLMGIFRVNMPMLYGEGEEHAFFRLQEEIMKVSDDHSLFAWRDFSSETLCGLLARSPRAFALSGDISPFFPRAKSRSIFHDEQGSPNHSASGFADS